MITRRSIPTRASYNTHIGDDATQLDILTRAFNQLAIEVVLGCRVSLHPYNGPEQGTSRPPCVRCGLRAAHLVHHPALQLVHDGLKTQDGAL